MTAKAAWRAEGLGVRQMRAFCRVFRSLSYAAAARELGLSVPTVWEQVRAVERAYGAVLFERHGRVVRPTPAAQVLAASLEPLLAGFDSTVELLREEAGEAPRTITLVTGVRMVLEELGRPLRRFQERHPEVRLRLFHGDEREAERRIGAEEADLALLLDPGPAGARRAVTIERAYEVDYLAVLHPGDPLARRGSLRLSDLAGRPLIVGHPGTYARQLLEQALYREGLHARMRVVVETDNAAYTMACVRAGMGAGIVAGREGGFLTRGLAVRPLRRLLGRGRIVFLWRKGRRPTRALLDLMRCVREGGAREPGRGV
jgi:DNA-binding transcriptional LysR family regulator